jgi:signal transduction histidine kinase
MNAKPRSLAARWMISPLEIAAIFAAIGLTLGGLAFSIQDALQLKEALDLNLTQTVILTQSIVNLQREVQLTHQEVTRLLGDLDVPPRPITRFDFVEIQVNNLMAQTESQDIKYIFAEEDLGLVDEIRTRTAITRQLIENLGQDDTGDGRRAILEALDAELGLLEGSTKKLIDRQSTTQRSAISHTGNSLRNSQRTDLLAGGVLLLMSIALAVVVRRGVASRLDRALEADQLKSQLLSSVSHELRTPLAAIQGYSQLMSEEAYGALTADQQTTLQRILINTAQLQGMVNNLLDRAQIEQGKLTLRNTQFAPSDLIETVHSALNILAVNKGMELSAEIAPEVPAELTGDVLRLQQILFNLTSNALKFTESGAVHTRIFMPDAAHWAVQVSDTGIGIAAEDQAHVFMPFWQTDSSATRKYRGSGLGLSIVKQLVDLMHGSISLASEPGKGSTFTIVLPLETA